MPINYKSLNFGPSRFRHPATLNPLITSERFFVLQDDLFRKILIITQKNHVNKSMVINIAGFEFFKEDSIQSDGLDGSNMNSWPYLHLVSLADQV